MSEEDTFKALRRIPFAQMFRLWSESPMTASTSGFEKIFEEHGWTWNDYLKIHYREYGHDRR